MEEKNAANRFTYRFYSNFNITFDPTEILASTSLLIITFTTYCVQILIKSLLFYYN